MEFVSIRIQEVERFEVAAEIWQFHDRYSKDDHSCCAAVTVRRKESSRAGPSLTNTEGGG
jgi:hypothetical protein